jgi:hypothetical protein
MIYYVCWCYTQIKLDLIDTGARYIEDENFLISSDYSLNDEAQMRNSNDLFDSKYE